MSHALDADFPTRIDDRYFEDYLPGSTYRYGYVAVTEAEILEFMRLFADHYLSHVAGLASPGVDELRRPAPLRPGDSVHLRATVRQARLSRSKPDRGVVHTEGELLRQDDQVVLRLTAVNLILCRPIA